MKAKMVDGTVYTVNRAEVTNGRLEIDFCDKTAEEVQAIFSTPENLHVIELLTDAGDKFGELPGWTVYGGVCLVGDTKTAILTKEPDVTAERITAAEAAALEAKTLAEETAGNLNAAVTELTMAMAGGVA
ncbi:hypothetical protein DWW31_18075 [Clostridium sp. AF15-17LB]|nr:hypothetical protein DWW31_18075 [Clostridium sp. AF15-17LB]